MAMFVFYVTSLLKSVYLWGQASLQILVIIGWTAESWISQALIFVSTIIQTMLAVGIHALLLAVTFILQALVIINWAITQAWMITGVAAHGTVYLGSQLLLLAVATLFNLPRLISILSTAGRSLFSQASVTFWRAFSFFGSWICHQGSVLGGAAQDILVNCIRIVIDVILACINMQLQILWSAIEIFLVGLASLIFLVFSFAFLAYLCHTAYHLDRWKLREALGAKDRIIVEWSMKHQSLNEKLCHLQKAKDMVTCVNEILEKRLAVVQRISSRFANDYQVFQQETARALRERDETNARSAVLAAKNKANAEKIKSSDAEFDKAMTAKNQELAVLHQHLEDQKLISYKLRIRIKSLESAVDGSLVADMKEELETVRKQKVLSLQQLSETKSSYRNQLDKLQVELAALSYNRIPTSEAGNQTAADPSPLPISASEMGTQTEEKVVDQEVASLLLELNDCSTIEIGTIEGDKEVANLLLGISTHLENNASSDTISYSPAMPKVDEHTSDVPNWALV